MGKKKEIEKKNTKGEGDTASVQRKYEKGRKEKKRKEKGRQMKRLTSGKQGLDIV